jgi:hypothetical protein
VIPVRAHRKSPCKECPFRKKSFPGYLGSSSPERMILATAQGIPMPCHLSLDYSDPQCLEKFERQEAGVLCHGALTTMANLCIVPRDRTLPRVIPNTHKFFSTRTDFIDHHRPRFGDRSWSDKEDVIGRRAGEQMTAGMPAGLILYQMSTTTEKKMPKHNNHETDESFISHEIDEALERIDESDLAGSGVSQSTTIEYYQSIVTALQLRIRTIQSEMKEDAPEDEDDYGSHDE